VHGSIRTSSCPDCGAAATFDEVVRMLETAPAPECPGCGSILKPDVVMFGELLPEEAMARASELAASAALLLIVGSSLEVHPVAGLPQETLAAGGAVAIVNQGATPYDGDAELRIDAPAGATLPAVAEGPSPG